MVQKCYLNHGTPRMSTVLLLYTIPPTVSLFLSRSCLRSSSCSGYTRIKIWRLSSDILHCSHWVIIVDSIWSTKKIRNILNLQSGTDRDSRGRKTSVEQKIVNSFLPELTGRIHVILWTPGRVIEVPKNPTSIRNIEEDKDSRKRVYYINYNGT